MPAPLVQPYPWDRLEQVSALMSRAARRARRGTRALEARLLARTLSDLLSTEVEVIGLRTSLRRRREAFADNGAAIDLRLGSIREFSVWVEAALADALAARLLGRVAPVVSRTAPIGSEQRGALAALCVETLRRIPDIEPAQPSPAAAPEALGAVVRATLVLEGRHYRTGVWASVDELPTSDTEPVSLRDLGDLPVSVPLVGARVVLERSELALLAPGDVVVPDAWDAVLSVEGADGPTLSKGFFCLLSPGSNRGMEVARSADGHLMLTGGVLTSLTTLEASENRMNDTEDTLVDTVLDTPVVIQVEVGAVTLAARDWAALSPGDVLETGVRIGEPVVLRVGGVEVARGELVSVDGCVGVRIQRVTTAGRRLQDSE